ncbi:manganese efflux pump MntP [Thalassotalea mangrovi]|uniref:Putative manganese efflux pump MntP n=1 Tax=Thalassotalea mangrovi TaxID=2572245 RepID=A0A4U1B914_9GAMM|nr:manganese efflux pump MntP family protein [Thalassotalea mangrovi]TKB47133.1 manganese efflux pump [Thalassotalea mangrovi]
MIEVIFLAIALSMDAFAVSIGLGSKPVSSKFRLAMIAAIMFGLFQGLMPLLGYLGGKGMLGWIDGFAPWLAFALLALVGAKMIYEGFAEGIEEDIAQITFKVMLILSLATSIDAMAAGFSLTLLAVQPLLACLVIAAVTAVFSALGVYIGHRSGTWLEGKAEVFGGLILIAIALKMVVG